MLNYSTSQRFYNRRQRLWQRFLLHPKFLPDFVQIQTRFSSVIPIITSVFPSKLSDVWNSPEIGQDCRLVEFSRVVPQHKKYRHLS